MAPTEIVLRGGPADGQIVDIGGGEYDPQGRLVRTLWPTEGSLAIDGQRCRYRRTPDGPVDVKPDAYAFVGT